jgi:hypothetical protein
VQDAVAKARPDQTIAICGGLINYALDQEADRWLSGLGSAVLSSLRNLPDGLFDQESPLGEGGIIREWIDREPTGAEPLARALGWSIRLPDYREGSEALMYGVQRGLEALRLNSVLTDSLAGQVLSECTTALSFGELDLWHLSGPTEAELEELDAVLTEEKAALAEDRVMKSSWLDLDLNERASAALRDMDDDVPYGTWWNHAWQDPDR